MYGLMNFVMLSLRLCMYSFKTSCVHLSRTLHILRQSWFFTANSYFQANMP